MTDTRLMEKLVSLAKRRGFVFQSSEIYGGLGSVWDYGPLGVELKRNVKECWWRAMVHAREDIEGLDAAILMHPSVWEASGHVSGFTDPLVDCRQCKNRFRADDQRIKGIPGEADAQCPVCGSRGTLTAPRLFNLMFKTFMGPVEEDASVVYLRPETAQGIYVNYLNVLQSSRQRIPFGIAQIGKAFRNEITPGNFIFRTREFEQMEMQYFVKPGEDMSWFEKWREWRMEWHRSLGLSPERLRWHEHGADELAHYARAAFDIEYEFPFGWNEIEGIHNRTDFDLSRHQEHSGRKLEYFDQAANQHYLPYIVETSAGADRVALTVLVDAYREEEVDGETRVVMGFHPALAPVKAGVFPLVKKDGMPEMARRIHADLQGRLPCFYDESGAIGRRYRRMDEAGTPWCITVDSDSAAGNDATIRERDSMQQERVSLDRLGSWLLERLAALLLMLLASPLAAQSLPEPDYRIGVVSESGDIVTWLVHGDSGLLEDRVVPVGIMPADIDGPHNITASADGKFYYISIAHGVPYGTLWKMTVDGDTVAGRAPLELFPTTIALTPDGELAFVANSDFHGDHPRVNVVSVVHTPTMTTIANLPACDMPHGVKSNHAGTRVYVSCMHSDELLEIDVASLAISRRVPVTAAHGTDHSGDGHCAPTYVAVSPDDSRIYLACNHSNTLQVRDAASLKLQAEIPVGKGAYNVGVSPDGSVVIVTNKKEQSVSIIDARAGKELARVAVTKPVVHGVAFSPDGRYAYISAESVGADPGSVDVLDLTTYRIVATFPVPAQPTGITVVRIPGRSK